MQNMTFDQALLQAKSSMNNGEIDRAKHLFEAVLKQTPKNKIAKRGLRQLSAMGNRFAVPNAAIFREMFAEEKFEELLECFDKANKTLSQDPDILIVVGATNYKMGSLGKAEEYLIRALKIKPSYFPALNTLAAVQHAKKDFDAALATYDECLNIEPESPIVFYNIARVFFELNDYKVCKNFLDSAIRLDPNFYSAYILMARILYLQGRRVESIQLYLLTIDLDPEDPEAYKGIAVVLNDTKFNDPIPELLPVLEKIIANRWYQDISEIAQTAISLVKLDHGLERVLQEVNEGGVLLSVEEVVEALTKYPMLLLLMENVPLADFEIEQVLRALRASLLFNRNKINNTSAVNNFVKTLALQCFQNEYLYYECDEESVAVYSLEQELKSRQFQGETLREFEIAILASYRPLYRLSWFEYKNMGSSMRGLIDLQSVEPLAEEKIKEKLSSFGDIENVISNEVRKQYEENPYPRWHKFHRPVPHNIDEFVKDINCKLIENSFLETQAPEILIAGCGTGHQALHSAARHKDSKVVAVDLSRASLAYAKRKSDELRVDNIQFLQGDILKLGLMEKQFDIVECSGVLHHMKDPMEGWNELLKCLKPGGLMNIGLYSEHAREHIKKIRDEIDCAGISSSLEDVRVFRNFLASSDEPHHRKILDSGDFYSYSTVRDLLFHVQEHRFTIPQITACIDSLGLVFCGFIDWKRLLDRADVKLADSSIYDLDWWDEKEQEAPHMFAGMYQMICQKPT